MASYSSSLLKQKTVHDCLIFLEQLFEQTQLYFGHGTDNSWDEAVQLVLWCLGLPVDSDQSVLPRSLTEQELQRILAAVEKRVSRRIPLPYITNEAWFMGLPFYVDDRVLIPRSPFAELISDEFSPWIESKDVHRVLEIGTGSGCIACAVASVFPNVDVVATDIDPNALEVASKNVAKHALENRIQLLRSDVFDQVQGRFDLIISNPPYVSDTEMATLPAEYNVEPEHALRADHDGLAIVDRLLSMACDFLHDHGILIVEVGNTDELVDQKYAHLELTWLSFSHGGHGVFLISKENLLKRG